jgi:predicted histone-like DNA-binding protein
MTKINYSWYETPSVEDGQKRYHVRVANTHRMSFREVCDRIELSSSPTRADVVGVVRSLSDLLIDRLSNGSSVHIEGIGYFSLSISAPSFDDPSEINARHIKVRSVEFRPEKKLIEEIAKEVQFKRAISCERSVPLSMKAVKRLLRDYMETNDYISAMEFRFLMNQTRATAYRRLRELCKGPRPILIKFGGPHSSIYKLNPEITID